MGRNGCGLACQQAAQLGLLSLLSTVLGPVRPGLMPIAEGHAAMAADVMERQHVRVRPGAAWCKNGGCR
jgi:hypothetical protein